MVSLIRDSIQELRRFRYLLRTTPSMQDIYEKLIAKHEALIKFYRSDEKVTVYLVEGLYEEGIYCRTSEEVDRELSNFGDDLDEDLVVKITIKKMSGCQFGRLPLLDL